MADYALGVVISGDYAYVTEYGVGLQVIQVFQRNVLLDKNIGRSLTLDAMDDPILRARLSTTQTDSVVWQLSADGGGSWQGIAPDGSWNQLSASGTYLLWRSTLVWAPSGVNPSVTRLEIE